MVPHLNWRYNLSVVPLLQGILLYRNNNKTELFIDSFVNKHINPQLLQYNNYMMYFYKESSKTNLVKIKENPRELDRYSAGHDLVYHYEWIDGKFEGRVKIKNGEQVEPELGKYNF